MNIKILSCLIIGLLLSMAAKALVPEPAEESYQPIPARNLFGLRALQQIADELPPPQLPRLLLTGITTILGDKRALMKLQPPAGKPGEAPKEQSLILSEGQRDGLIEVLAIDEKAGSVRVNNSGTVMMLTFEKDGVKLPNTPLPSGVMPGLPTPVNGVPPPGGHPNLTPPPGGGNGRFRGFNPRNGVSPAPGMLPTDGSSGPQAVKTLSANPTPEEQTILMELQRQANQQSSGFPPLPPTDLTPNAGTSTTPTPGANLPAAP